MADQQTITISNGINMNALWDTINAVKDEPVLGKSKFRIHNKWLKGGRNETTVGDFYGAGQENSHRTFAKLKLGIYYSGKSVSRFSENNRPSRP
ncbi:MAG TPA: hypothetical protein ENI81_10565 [Phycisphaerales bacterium]|nr:hypothetical protein [Phycisphaerales bacterium]